MIQIFYFNSMRPSDAYRRQLIAIICSDNSLSPGQHQAIFWTHKNIERHTADTILSWPNPKTMDNSPWWNIVNWTIRNQLQWNPNRNSYIFIEENAFENVVWKMVAILSRPLCCIIASFMGHYCYTFCMNPVSYIHIWTRIAVCAIILVYNYHSMCCR